MQDVLKSEQSSGVCLSVILAHSVSDESRLKGKVQEFFKRDMMMTAQQIPR
jgi:hypothetical protein